MDKEGYSKDVVHDSGGNPQRMVAAPTILPLASATSACGTVGAIPICNVPTKFKFKSLYDLMDFLRRSKWKMYQSTSRRKSVANFLTVLDTT